MFFTSPPQSEMLIETIAPTPLPSGMRTRGLIHLRATRRRCDEKNVYEDKCSWLVIMVYSELHLARV